MLSLLEIYFMLKSYKYRLLPTDEQKQLLNGWMGSCRFIFNLGLETKMAAWASARRNVTCFDLMRQLTELKETEATWLSECPRQSLESSLTNLETAYTSFFKGRGKFPKFKKRSNRQSITFRRDSKIEDGKIKLTKIGLVDLILHRPLGEGEIRTVTVTKTPTNKYFVSILVKNELELPDKKPVKESTTVGIDVGLKTFATLSDNTTFENPKYLQHQLKRLRIEQRKLDRRYKKGVKTELQSKGWHKQKIVVALLHEKITNQRSHFLHNVSTSIVKKHDTICLEDLNVSGMMKNDNLSKAISDVGWSEFNRMLEYKAEWNGKNILKIGRFDPSSKLCSNCGTINKELKLSDRVWICEKCGTTHDRDENAAKNIKSFGLRTKPSTVKTSQ
jgi:putative transposase